MRFWTFGFLVVFPLCAVCCAGMARAQSLPAVGTYTDEIARSKSLGFPTRAMELAVTLPPDEENAAVYYPQLTKLLEGHPNSDERIVKAIESRPLKPEDIESLREPVTANQDVFDLLSKALARPKCVFAHDWAATDSDIKMPELATARACADLLLARSLVQATEGHATEAAHSAAKGFQISEQLKSDRILMGGLNRLRIQQRTIDTLADILFLSNGNPETASAVSDEIAGHFELVDLKDILAGELAYSSLLPSYMTRPDGVSASDRADIMKYGGNVAKTLGYDRFIQENMPYYHSRLRAIALVSNGPLERSIAVEEAIKYEATQPVDPYDLVGAMMLPTFARAYRVRLYALTSARLVRVAARILTWQAKHGAPPSSLSEIGGAPPLDPYGNGLLHYHHTATDWTVWSIGFGKKDQLDAHSQPDKSCPSFTWDSYRS